PLRSPLSLHVALPIFASGRLLSHDVVGSIGRKSNARSKIAVSKAACSCSLTNRSGGNSGAIAGLDNFYTVRLRIAGHDQSSQRIDRKSTRLNSSHVAN